MMMSLEREYRLIEARMSCVARSLGQAAVSRERGVRRRGGVLPGTAAPGSWEKISRTVTSRGALSCPLSGNQFGTSVQKDLSFLGASEWKRLLFLLVFCQVLFLEDHVFDRV